MDQALQDIIKNAQDNNAQDDNTNNTYMFINRKRNLQVYVDADGYAEAVDKFDSCEFENPKDWEIYLKVKERSN